jgi:hypothetical protein
MPEIGETYRTKDGQGRSTYDPVWSASKPWSVVVRGTVVGYRPTLEAAKIALAEHGCDSGVSVPVYKCLTLMEAAHWNGGPLTSS